jgi:hypothetical protein
MQAASSFVAQKLGKGKKLKNSPSEAQQHHARLVGAKRVESGF